MSEETQGMGQSQTEPNTELPQAEFEITQNTEQPQPESEVVENTRQPDTGIYDAPDVYQSQSGQDIYQTPVTGSEYQGFGGMFSGSVPADNAPGNNVSENNVPHNNTQFIPNTYISPEYGNPYGSGSAFGNEYQTNPYGGNQNPYGDNQNPYGYNGNSAGQNPYGSNGNAAGQNPYGNYGMGSNQNPYGNGYGGGPNGYNPQYSPYAMPQKKKYTGLIIGLIITLVVLFLVAVIALFYRTFAVISNRRSEQERERHDRYSPWDDDYEDYDDYSYGYDDDFEYGDFEDFEDYFYNQYGDDYFDEDYDYDADKYYTLHHDIKDGLSYSVDLETYYYEADNNNNVSIEVEYPVIKGENVPNLDKINETIQKEMTAITDYYEEEYANYMDEDSDYFFADATGYVAYMDEDVLSVVFDERIYSDYYSSVTLYCINVDMRDGVILDNVNLINVDDDFSVDFRLRSDEQNGTIDELDWMTDQEITKYLTSADNLIIFYTPQGMEIGFNYREGWVTVTYPDYKDYLKIF